MAIDSSVMEAAAEPQAEFSPAPPPEPAARGKRTFGPLEPPESTQPVVVYWPYVISLATVHAAALLVFVPYFYSLSAVILTLISYVICNMFGITIGYHRLLTHQGFRCPKWMEHALAICGMCTLQDSPARWVAIHRMHHQHSDEQPDPHSPLVSLWWSHAGWLFVRNRRHEDINSFERYARDLLRDRFYLNAERKLGWLRIYIYHTLAIMAAGFAFGYATGGTFAAATQLMFSWLVWGVFLRTVATLHITWAVNSASHVWGYQSYETRDNSRNNWWVALLSFGEGWHNNHHAHPRAARHGHRWWELDMSWLVILFWEKIGLVDRVARPPRRAPAASHEEA